MRNTTLFQHAVLKHRHPNSGMALLPLILLIMIFGVMLGVGLNLIKPQTSRFQHVQTQKALDAAVDEIISWAVVNGRLPDDTEFPNIVRRAQDLWLTPLVYIYDNDLTDPATGGLCGRLTTGIIGSQANMAFIVLSAGENRQVDSAPSGSGAYTGTFNASSQDIVREVSLNSLLSRAHCDGPTPGQLSILTKSVPTNVCRGNVYNATIYAEGGVPSGGSYYWCVSGSLPPGIADPTVADCSAVSDCTTLLDNQGGMATADLALAGTPTTEGTYPFTVYLRDDNQAGSGTNDTCIQRSYTITVKSCGSPLPVAAWKLDEGGGANAADSVGSHNGTLQGDATWTADTFSKTGSALSLDGNGDYVRVNDSEDLRLTGELTLAAWVKETDNNNFAKIISRRSGDYFYFLGVHNGRPYGGIGDGSNHTETAKSFLLPLNQWHHLALTYDDAADTMKIYYDGTLKETTSVSQSLPATADVDLTIGGDSQGTEYFFSGLIDDVAIYDQALTDAEVTDLVNAFCSSQMIYPFNGDANDTSGNDNHGTVHGATLTTDRFNVASNAYSFNGSSQYILVEKSCLSYSGEVTVMAWVDETDSKASATIVSRRNGNEFFSLWINQGKPYGGIDDGVSRTTTAKSFHMPLNEWHHLALTYAESDQKLRLYYDGALTETADVTGTLPGQVTDMSIGADSLGTYGYFEGKIDEIQIENRAWSASEITTYYNTSRP